MGLSLLLSLHLKRWWTNFSVIMLITAFTWAFCYSIRAFFREEYLNLELLILLLLKTLPSILPFVIAVATMMTIINMRQKKEWQLSQLLGLGHFKRHLLFLPALITLGLFSTLLELRIEPDLNRKIQWIAIHQQLHQVKAQQILKFGKWSITKSQNQVWYLSGPDELIQCQNISIDEQGLLQIDHGIHWKVTEQNDHRSQTASPSSSLHFGNFSFPILNKGHPTENHHSLPQYIKLLLLPIALYALGFSLGWQHQKKQFKKTFFWSFSTLFLIYYPSTIPGKNLKGDSFQDMVFMFAPHALCFALCFLILTIRKHLKKRHVQAHSKS